MQPDDEICYCYHVSLRKLTNFAARERPSVPSRMSECLGAGTGCGWCIPFLKRIQANALAEIDDASGSPPAVELSAAEYAERRQNYIKTHQPRNEF